MNATLNGSTNILVTNEEAGELNVANKSENKGTMEVKGILSFKGNACLLYTSSKEKGTTSTRSIPPLMKGYILCPPISNFTVCPCFNALAASLKKVLDTTIFRMSQRLFHKIDGPHLHLASKPNDIQVYW